MEQNVAEGKKTYEKLTRLGKVVYWQMVSKGNDSPLAFDNNVFRTLFIYPQVALRNINLNAITAVTLEDIVKGFINSQGTALPQDLRQAITYMSRAGFSSSGWDAAKTLLENSEEGPWKKFGLKLYSFREQYLWRDRYYDEEENDKILETSPGEFKIVKGEKRSVKYGQELNSFSFDTYVNNVGHFKKETSSLFHLFQELEEPCKGLFHDYLLMGLIKSFGKLKYSADWENWLSLARLVSPADFGLIRDVYSQERNDWAKDQELFVVTGIKSAKLVERERDYVDCLKELKAAKTAEEKKNKKVIRICLIAGLLLWAFVSLMVRSKKITHDELTPDDLEITVVKRECSINNAGQYEVKFILRIRNKSSLAMRNLEGKMAFSIEGREIGSGDVAIQPVPEKTTKEVAVSFKGTNQAIRDLYEKDFEKIMITLRIEKLATVNGTQTYSVVKTIKEAK